MQNELSNIRVCTNRIIETGNPGHPMKTSFTDFIMLDYIYQKVFMSPEIEQVVLFTGDGDFSSVASYLRNFCDKVVGIYGIEDAISSQLEATADWCISLPFEEEAAVENLRGACRSALLNNLQSAEEKEQYPMFRKTVQKTSKEYSLPADLLTAELHALLEEGIVSSVKKVSRHNNQRMLNVLEVDWEKAYSAAE